MQNISKVLNCNQLTKTVQPTYSRSDTLTFLNGVYPTYSSLDQQQLEAAEKPRAGRSEVS